MNKKRLKSLDVNILRNKRSKIISTEEALKNVTPFEWSEDVIAGKRKITVDKPTR